jgi:electron transport complex protein RnfC
VERPWPDRQRADLARERYRRRQQRLQREAAEKQARRHRPRQATADAACGSEKPSLEQRRAVIAAALARSRAKKAQRRSEQES